MKILITGGAGFIGSFLLERLLKDGHHITILDNLDPLVHGNNKKWPTYLPPSSEQFIKILGDIRDYQTVKKSLRDVEAVLHLAAKTSVGLSKSEETIFRDINVTGTEILKTACEEVGTVKTIILSSSRAVYGEGAYVDRSGQVVKGLKRKVSDMQNGFFNINQQSTMNTQLVDIPTSENHPLCPVSVYGETKRDQEDILINMKGVSVRILRYFNVYGPRQALDNPYVGIMALFVKLILNGQKIEIFEDGKMKRDFVNINDVVSATLIALYNKKPYNFICNVGSGEIITILQSAEIISKLLGKPFQYQISGRFREGDIRHCYADLNHAKKIIGYEPRIRFQDGMKMYIPWVEKQLIGD